VIMEKTAYSNIYRFLRDENYSSVLRNMLNANGRIRNKYSENLNHAWYLVGDALFRKGNYRGAIKAFKKSFLNSNGADVEALWAISDAYEALNDRRWSIYYLKKALDIDPHRVELLYNLANNYFDLGDYERAILFYDKVTGKGGSDIEKKAQINRRKALNNLRHRDQA